MINVSYIIIAITVQVVIMGIPAIVVTEFFICTTMKHMVTTETNFSFFDHLIEFEYGFKHLLK